jgi:glycosyltransferase involved in cell wall biosynthesis
MIFSQNKHGWESYGNEKIIYAVSQALKQQSQLNIKVVFFEFGWHVQRSKDLIRDLKLEHYFEWMPMMPRKELMYGLNMADLGINELVNGAFMAGSIFECMALGVPLIQCRNDEQHSKVFPALPPIVNTDKTDEVAEHILRFSAHQDEYRKIGEDAMKWFNQYVVGESMAAIVSMIESKK